MEGNKDGMSRFERIEECTKFTILSALIILMAQWVGKGISPLEALPGMILICLIVGAGLLLKGILPGNFPSFAWVTLLGLVCSLPGVPWSGKFLELTNKVDFLTTTTPILAAAGISVGNKVDILKKISWKLIIIALVVFTSTFFGSAIISQIILTFQGKI